MNEIDSLCMFASRYFNVEEGDLYGRKRTAECVIARHMTMYVLHTDYDVSVGTLGKIFFRKRRGIFQCLSKVRYWIKTQRYYREMYERFVEEYKKSHT